LSKVRQSGVGGSLCPQLYFKYPSIDMHVHKQLSLDRVFTKGIQHNATLSIISPATSDLSADSKAVAEDWQLWDISILLKLESPVYMIDDESNSLVICHRGRRKQGGLVTPEPEFVSSRMRSCTPQ
jgi:hypothetical protein